MLNFVTLAGAVEGDVTRKSMQSGTAIAEFRIKTWRSWRDPQGVERTADSYHSIVVYGKLCETAYELTPGRLIVLQGEISNRSWDDPKSGQKRFKTEIKATSIQALSGWAASSPEVPPEADAQDDNIPW